jgi:hypothetical protein
MKRTGTTYKGILNWKDHDLDKSLRNTDAGIDIRIAEC